MIILVILLDENEVLNEENMVKAKIGDLGKRQPR